jgi:hypothetical protein
MTVERTNVAALVAMFAVGYYVGKNDLPDEVWCKSMAGSALELATHGRRSDSSGFGCNHSWTLLKVGVGKNKEAGNRWRGFEKILLIVSGVIFAGEVVITMTRAVFYERRNFPVGAVEYLKTHGYPGRAFNKYGWGGYLEWKMPDEKCFIDGRMSNWVTDDAPPGESNWAFKDYLRVLRGEIPAEEIWNKYGIETLILESRKGFSETKFLLKWSRQGAGRRLIWRRNC